MDAAQHLQHRERQIEARPTGNQGTDDTLPEAKRLRYKNNYTIYIYEVGYGSDTRLDDKEYTKLEQHKHLEELLQKEGWKVAYKAIPLGTTGGIHKVLKETLEKDLKLSKTQVEKTCNKLHDLAVSMAHALVRKRRHLEYSEAAGYYRAKSYNSGSNILGKRPRQTGNQAQLERCTLGKRPRQAIGAVT